MFNALRSSSSPSPSTPAKDATPKGPPKKDCCRATPIGDDEVCWICLASGSSEDGGALQAPCRCPRAVHFQCLARWQLQSAGTGEATHCRFCEQALPDWRSAYALPAAPVAPPPPVMAVVYGDQVYKIPVRPGVDGIAEFKARVKLLFGFPMDLDFDVTFECRSPASTNGTGGDRLILKGLSSYDSAAHCAAHSAAARTASCPSALGGM